MYFSKTQCDALYFMKHILMQFCFDIISSPAGQLRKTQRKSLNYYVLLILYYIVGTLCSFQ